MSVETPPKPRSRPAITAALMLIMILASMEQTVTSTAMPTIIGDLHGLEFYAWVISIYLLAATVVMPLYGRLADIWGRKRVIVLAMALFILGSVLCSVAQSMPQLIFFCALQGLGAGGIMPVVLTILGDIYTIPERARIQGFFSAIWGSASLAGPWLGARLVTSLGWRSIFWVNLPFGVLGLIVLAVFYHDHEKPHSTELDLPGVASLGAGAVALLLFFSLLGHPTASAWITLPSLGVAAFALLLFFFWHERRTPNPIMSPALLFRPDIGPALLGSLLLGVCVFSLDTWVPLYVQGGQGGTARDAAATVTPVMFAWATSAFFAAPLLMKWGFRRTAIVGAALIIAGFTGLILCSLLHAPRWVLTAVLLLSGLGFGPTSFSYILGAEDAVPWQQRGLITSSITFTRSIGGALGVSIMGTLFNLLLRPGLATLEAQGYASKQLLDPDFQQKLPHNILLNSQSLIATNLRWLFGLMLAAALCQLYISRFIPRHGHQPKPTPAEAIEAALN